MMASQISLLNQLIPWFIYFLPYAMGVVFVGAAFFRLMVYYTVRRHEWFAREFEARVNRYVEGEIPGRTKNASFYVLAKRMLERTFYECFAVRDRRYRTRRDGVMALSDRIFLIKPGCAWLVKDILKQLKFLRWTNETPKLIHITRATLHHNPNFNKVFGIIPITALNDMLNILPGLFVVAGILGTFLGIKGGLGSLGGMNLADIEQTKSIMDAFLHEIAYAMASSIVGISFSLMLHVWNVSFSPERAYVSMVDRFENALDQLWYRADNNEFPNQERPFDENRDPVEALAEEAINLEISRSTHLKHEPGIEDKQAS